MKQPNPYAAILDWPHHTSAVHTPMARAERAAQFSPFAALTGYDDAVRETARLTDRQLTLAEDALLALERQLRQVQSLLDSGETPWVQLCYFVPDAKKAGGAYRTVRGQVRRVNTVARTLCFAQGLVVPLDAVSDLSLTAAPDGA